MVKPILADLCKRYIKHKDLIHNICIYIYLYISHVLYYPLIILTGGTPLRQKILHVTSISCDTCDKLMSAHFSKNNYRYIINYKNHIHMLNAHWLISYITMCTHYTDSLLLHLFNPILLLSLTLSILRFSS